MEDGKNGKLRGLPIVLSGPSGSGKGTVVRNLLQNYSDFELSVSVTTRAPREKEIDHVHYHFITDEAYEKMEAEGALLEHAGYVGHRYGTPVEEVESRCAAGINVILEIEMQGAFQIREKRPDAVLIFLLPPSAEVLEARLRGRGTDTEEDIIARLAKAREEIAHADRYDFVLVNEENAADKTADLVAAIAHAMQHRTEYQKNRLAEFLG